MAEESHRNFTIDFKEKFGNITDDEEREAIFENQTYYSSKYSNVSNLVIEQEIPKSINVSRLRNMTFEQDTHFYNISVNITHSSVHVPTNIFDRSVYIFFHLLIKTQ